ncbi:FkbH-like protein [Streptacidiphilus sp. PB12-B1b]|uniref:FkbH-like protein n=1 Tax=Streptacidiphilus sp. PB12-B1b TaxID=2705012 RepID=UPI002103CD85|nr:FkbH-like protein [Streptacidiphilus sp. PB12-B1b]
MAWDLDGTLWDGVAVESPPGTLPELRPPALDAVDALTAMGVVSSIASRTDPAVLELVAADPRLAGRFLAPQVGWCDKSVSLRAIAADLGIGVEALALVDDNPYERAEVAAMLPDAQVLRPDEVAELLAALAGQPVTGDARNRVGRYRDEEQRSRAGRSFDGPREQFLESCRMRLTLTRARPDDVPRFVELAARTHRLNSSGLELDADRVRGLLADGSHLLLTARLEDRFGDYGLIGAALVERGAAAWTVRLLALSCRVAGRGVSAAFLYGVMREARRCGAGELLVDSAPTSANVELRLLFRQAGLRRSADLLPEPGAPSSYAAVEAEGIPAREPRVRRLGRSLLDPLPNFPSWLDVVEPGRELDDGE